MRKSEPLPPEARRAFLSRESTLLGIGTDRLRRADVSHPFRGVSKSGPGATTILERAHDYRPLLRDGQVFSHLTAAAAWGAPVRDDGSVHVSVLFPTTPPRGIGVHGHSLQRLDPRMLGSLPLSGPSAAWLESAAVVSKEELVVLGDSLVTPRHRGGRAVTSLEELRRAADRVGVPGLRRAEWALPRIRVGVRSRRETELRLLIVAAGLPEPVVEHPVEVRPGVFRHPDLMFVTARLALEYEGDGHRTDKWTWRTDITRREELEAVDVRTMRVTAYDLDRQPDALIARIATVLRRRGG